MKHYRIILFSVLLIVLCVITSPAKAFKDFRGKVIDADTKEPIEGAVVAAVWVREVTHFPSGTTSKFKKARETLTDKNGEFSIKPYHHYSLRPFSKLWLSWIIFKPGYASFYPGHSRLHPKVKWQLDSGKIFCPYTVVELPKLKTKKERRKYLIGPPGHPVPYDKTPLLIEAINVERVNLGLQPTFEMKEPNK